MSIIFLYTTSTFDNSVFKNSKLYCPCRTSFLILVKLPRQQSVHRLHYQCICQSLLWRGGHLDLDAISKRFPHLAVVDGAIWASALNIL